MQDKSTSHNGFGILLFTGGVVVNGIGIVNAGYKTRECQRYFYSDVNIIMRTSGAVSIATPHIAAASRWSTIIKR